MSNVYAFGYKAPDTFGRLGGNQWLYDGVHGQDYYVEHGGDKYDYWRLRDEALSKNTNIIRQAQDTDAEALIRQMTRHTSSDMDIAQVIASKSQWEIVRNITQENGSGKIVTYDIETLGDIGLTGTHKVVANNIASYQRFDGYAGITEIGFNVQDFNNGVAGNPRAVSIAIGIDEGQQKQLAKLISKYEQQGWKALDRTEQSTLERLTMYAGKYNDIFGEDTIDFLGGGKYSIVHTLGKPTHLAKDMRSGLQNLTHLYLYGPNGKASNVLQTVTDYIIATSNEANSVLVAANARFDAYGLANQGRILGLNTGFNPDEIIDNTADVIYAQRAMNKVDRISALDHQNRIHEDKTFVGTTPNTVNNTMNSLRMGDTEIHMGASDAGFQSRIATTQSFIPVKDGYKSFADAAIEAADKAGIAPTDYTQQYFLLERGQLNKNALDQANVDGQITYSHSIAGSYYEIDVENSGYVRYTGPVEEGTTREATESFVLALRNADASENTTVYIEADSLEDALNRLDNNSTMIEKSRISEEQIVAQTKQKYDDIARREYAKFFDPSEVTVTSGRDEYGVAGLKKYLSISDEVYERIGDTDIRSMTELNKISDILESHGLKSTYQKRTFAGMYSQLHGERDFLLDAIEYIEGNAGSTNNFTRTSILRDAVDNFRMSIGPEPASDILLQDAFGIDINTSTGTHRINATTAQHATSDLSRIFRNASRDDIESAMKDLLDRKVITTSQYQQVARNISDSALTGTFYNSFVNMGYMFSDIVSPIRDAQNPLDFMQGIYTDTSHGLTEEVSVALKNKTTHGLGRNIAKFSSGVTSTDLHSFLDTAIQNAKVLDFGADQKSVLTAVSDALNYSDAERNILFGMFMQRDGEGKFKKYAINGRSDIAAFVVSPSEQGKNAYIMLTNRAHANTLAEAIRDNTLDFSSRAALVESSKEFASVFELPYINKADLGEYQSPEVASIFGNSRAQVVSINQGKSYERFMIPTFDVYMQDDMVRAEIKSGTEQYLSTFRMKSDALDAVARGEFEKASKGWSRAQNKVLAPLSAPSSYRAFQLADGSVRRVANYNINDYLHGYNFNTEKMMRLLEYTASVESDNSVKRMLDMFNESKLIAVDSSGRAKAGRYYDVMHSQQFKEFFTKNLFVGSVAEDMNIAGQIANYTQGQQAYEGLRSSLDKNIFGIIRDVVETDKKFFSDSVRSALSKIHAATPHLSQVVSESGVASGIVSFMRHGDIFWNGAINPTLRPTYTQAGNAILFEAKDFDVNSLSRGARLGSVLRTHTENDILRAMDETYVAPSGAKYSSQYRNMTTTFKQMSDADLQFGYRGIQENLGDVARRYGLDESTLEEALRIFKSENMSLNEGKWIGRARVFNEYAFTSADVKRVNIQNMDINYLNDFIGREIAQGDVIGKSNGHHVYWEGPATILTRDNVEELLSARRETTVLPIRADIQDIKLMFGNAEKATLHTIRVDDNFMRTHGVFGSKDEALRYFDAIFDELTGTSKGAYQADVIGNMSLGKHTTNLATDSIFRVIVNEYQQAGRLGELAAIMQKMDEFAGWNIQSDGSILLGSNSQYQGIASSYNALIERIRNNDFGNEIVNRDFREINARITDIIDEIHSNDLIYGELTRTGQNQHMGTSVTLDQRMEQAIRLRNRARFDVNSTNGVIEGVTGTNGETWEQIYTRTLRENIYSGKYHEVGDMGTDLVETRALFQSISDSKNRRFASHIEAVKEKKGILGGIVESLLWSDTPDINYIKGKNILEVSMSDVISRLPESGASADDLQEFLFNIDGTPSNYLRRLAAEQNVNLSSGSYSMYLDFDGAEVAIKSGSTERLYKGLLVPVQNVRTNAEDAIFWVNHQKDIINFINRYKENVDDLFLNTHNTGKVAVADAMERLFTAWTHELATMDKDSEAYKVIGKMLLPNSTQVLAQDEVAAFVSGMDTEDMRNLIIRERQLREAISSGDLSQILELDEVIAQKHGILNAVADEISEGKVLDFVQLQNANMASRGKITIGNKTFYDNAVGISRETFRAMDFDFDRAGFDLFRDMDENGFIKSYDGKGVFQITDDDISQIIKNLEDNGIHVQDRNTTGIRKAVEEYSISIRDLNATIAEKSKAKNAFGFLGERYASEVGIVGREAWRYPVFRSQNAVRYYLDNSVMGKQIRYYNPAFSSIINVDFDGDTGSISLAGETLRKIDGSDTEYYALFRSYQAGLSNNNQLIAALVRDGDAFKKDLGSDVFIANANALKSFDEDAYNAAVEAFARRQGYDVANLTQGQIFAANYSPEVMQAFRAWDESEGNLLYNQKVIKASLTAKIRKEEIGSTSTPNFTLRNAVESIINNPKFSNEQRANFADILDVLTNSSTKEGGILTLTEQKSIDVKHILDAYNVADTPKWATGLSTMFNMSSTRSKVTGLRDLLEASNHILFKFKDSAQYDAVINEIIDGDNTVQAFTKRIMAATDEAEIKDLTYKRYFRAIYEMSQIDEAAQVYKMALNKGGNYEAAVRALKQIRTEYGNIDDKTIHEILSHFLRDFTSEGSADRLLTDRSTMHIAIGSLMDRGISNDGKHMGNYGLVFSRFKDTKDGPVALFQRRDLNTLKIIDTVEIAGTNAQINKTLQRISGGIPAVNVHNYKESLDARIGLKQNAALYRRVNFIEDVLYRNGFDTLESVSRSSARMAGVEDVIGDVRELFSSHSTVTRSAELIDAYRYALDKDYTHKGVDALIRDLNESIASHPERYKRLHPEYDGGNYFEEYDTLLRRHMIQEGFGGDTEKFEAILRERQVMSGFDSPKYKQSLDFLNSGLYDIIDEENLLRQSYQTLEGLPGEEIGNVLKHKDVDISEKIKSLKASNLSTVQTAQDRIYGLFNSHNQMSTYFNWSQASANSMVGYGEYIGIRFDKLSQADITRILSSTNQAGENTLEGFAFKRTNELLTEYVNGRNITVSQSALRTANRIKKSSDVDTIIRSHRDIVNRIQTVNPDAMPKIKKRKLSDELFSHAKNIDVKSLAPKVGVGLAAMAAIGIANNMLHNQKNQSPLTPARKENGNQEPNIRQTPANSGGYQPQAPASRQKTVYHDNRSGLQFKVTAKTKNYINDTNNARLISMAGGGQSNVISQADMSGVSNNWLANKFAELS